MGRAVAVLPCPSSSRHHPHSVGPYQGRKFGNIVCNAGILLFLLFVASVRHAPAQCMNIAGPWSASESGTVTLTITAMGQTETDTEPVSVSGNINMTQTGQCTFQYQPIPIGCGSWCEQNPQMLTRSVSVSGNNVQISGVFVVINYAEAQQQCVTINSVYPNTYTASGQVTTNAIDVSTMNLTGTGNAAVTGTIQYPCQQGQTYSFTLTITASTTAAYTASGLLPTTQLLVTPHGPGAVRSQDGFLYCDSECALNYVTGTTVDLIAQRYAFSLLRGWEGCDSGQQETCSVTMTHARSVQAAFAAIYVMEIWTEGSGGGTVSSGDGLIRNCTGFCLQDYEAGSILTLTATPSQGSTFIGWDSCPSGQGNRCAITANQDTQIAAYFSKSGANTLSVVTQGIGNVTSADGQINCGPYCSGSYSGRVTTLTATPGYGANTNWTGCDSSNGNSCSLLVRTPRTVTATFTGGLPALRFVPVAPCRVADTRNENGTFGGPPISGSTSRDFPIPQSGCNIPSTALAYSLNVTAVPKGYLGYVTIWPAGLPRPGVSLMNSYDGRIKANAAILPAGDAAHHQAVSVYATDTTDVAIDINGYFEAVGNNSALAFYPVAPCRIADTRNPNGPLGGPYMSAKSTREFPVRTSGCNLPQTAQAYSMNFTVVPRGPLNFLTVWPSDQGQPWVSTLNAPTGQTTANAAIVPAAKNGGDISAYVTNDTDLVIDVNGYFAPAGQGGLSLYPVPPCRVLDTRSSSGISFAELTVNVAGSPCPQPLTAQAYAFNATVVPTVELGYLSLWPDGQPQPWVSTLNASDGAVTSNMAIVPASNGLIDSFVSNLSHLLLDISGYFAP